LREIRLQVHPEGSGENARPGRSGPAADRRTDAWRIRRRLRPDPPGLALAKHAKYFAVRPRDPSPRWLRGGERAGMNGEVLPTLSCPGRSERSDQQQKSDETGEDRQDADAAHNAGVSHLQADPIVALEGRAGAHGHHARHIDTIALRNPPGVPTG